MKGLCARPSRRRLPQLVAILALVLLAACQTAPPALPPEPPAAVPKGELTIGSKSITEQYLLMKMSALLLRAQGYRVHETVFLDSQAIRGAMEAGVLDLYWEYTTTARIYYHKRDPVYDPDEAFEAVKAQDKSQGIVWLPRSGFDSSWAVLMRKDFAERKSIERISDLAKYVTNEHPLMRFATNEEYLDREDGLNRLLDVYDFRLSPEQVIAVESDLLSQSVKDGRVEAVVGLASDPRARTFSLTRLEDDLRAFPPYEAAPVVRADALSAHPDVLDTLETLTPFVTNDSMLELMYQVDILQKDISKTARDFLVGRGLLEPL